MATPENTPKLIGATITSVSYGRTVNIGNYENIRFDLTAAVGPDEDWRDVMESLRRKARKLKDRITTEGD